MTLKASYFAFAGLSDMAPIKSSDLQKATGSTARQCGLAWPPGRGSWHNLTCWADLLVRYRNHLGQPYADPHFGSSVVAHATAIYLRWRETLRYHKNTAYPQEVGRVRDSTRWLLDNCRRL
jgi:hypothetical protein